MPDPKPRILFVCLGNICRSPMAEGIFRHKAEEFGLDVEFDSCGTGGWHVGEAPDARARQCAKSYGVDISKLRARQFSSEDFDRFDMIFAMDTSNYRDIVSLAKKEHHKSKVRLMLDEIYPDENRSVPDPYYGGAQGFDHVFDLLSQAAERVLGKLNRG